jgi:hypothetical protein
MTLTLTETVVDWDPELQKLVVITAPNRAPVKKVLDRGPVEALIGERAKELVIGQSSKFQWVHSVSSVAVTVLRGQFGDPERGMPAVGSRYPRTRGRADQEDSVRDIEL